MKGRIILNVNNFDWEDRTFDKQIYIMKEYVKFIRNLRKISLMGKRDLC